MPRDLDTAEDYERLVAGMDTGGPERPCEPGREHGGGA
jgi:hypothetical protein